MTLPWTYVKIQNDSLMQSGHRQITDSIHVYTSIAFYENVDIYSNHNQHVPWY